jgi:glycosyltransferase involved in cell wall biosynthesis
MNQPIQNGLVEPLVSIVMPSLNQARFINDAIDSIFSQEYRKVELIVADGGSTDDTVGCLAERQSTDARLRWVSAKDTGPAQAINSALKLVRGTVVGWLNSDDIYALGAVQRAVTTLQANPKWLMIYGHGEHVDDLGMRLHSYPTLPPDTPISQFTEGCFICQPTVFTRRTLWKLLGPLDENLKTAFDFEYWLRAFSAFPERIGFVDAVQAHSRLHAGCITVRMRRTIALEGMQVLARHLGSAPKEWLLTYVNELLAAPDGANIDDIRVQVDDALSVVHQWLPEGDLPELRLILEKLLVTL